MKNEKTNDFLSFFPGNLSHHNPFYAPGTPDESSSNLRVSTSQIISTTQYQSNLPHDHSHTHNAPFNNPPLLPRQKFMATTSVHNAREPRQKREQIHQHEYQYHREPHQNLPPLNMSHLSHPSQLVETSLSQSLVTMQDGVIKNNGYSATIDSCYSTAEKSDERILPV